MPSDPQEFFERKRGRGASKQFEVKKKGGVTPKHIVYAGDFQIVYVFAPVNGELILLKPGEVFTFGRGDMCDCKIDAKTVSRRHARVHWSSAETPTPELVDLESRNGITINGVPMTKKVLEDGDEVKIGPFTATLRVLSANDDLENQIQIDRMSATMVSAARLSGETRLVPLPFLLNHLERIKESGTLAATGADGLVGSVTMISGVVIAASYGDTEGVDAVRELAKMRDGRFTFSPRADATPQSIQGTIAEILGLNRQMARPPTAKFRVPPRRRRPPPRRPRPRRR